MLGSVLFLAGAWFTVGTMQGEPASHLAHYAAIGIGLSLLASVIVDWRDGLLNLIRADLLAILALYFLTMFEFLFKQEHFDAQADIPLALWHRAMFEGTFAGNQVDDVAPAAFHHCLRHHAAAAVCQHVICCESHSGRVKHHRAICLRVEVDNQSAESSSLCCARQS